MLFLLDPTAAMSIAAQLAVQVRSSIADGTLAPGERLPPARELSRALDINMHTVLRAYAQLRDDGVIEMRQGRGAWVRKDVAPGTIRLSEMVDALLSEARKLGLRPADVVTLIERRS